MLSPHAPRPITGAWSLFGLDPAMTHLNHGSVGAVPLPVRRARQRITDDLERDPRGAFKQRVDTTTAARRVCAEFIGAAPESTAFVTNVTTGIAQVLHAMDFSAGDEIVTTDHGYGSIDANIAAVGRARGTVHRVAAIPLTPTDDEVVDAVLAAVTERTRLVVCDHITSSTARLFPIARIADELRRRDVPLLVDAAHVPGHLDADIDVIGADFWVGNLHKWAFAPRGTALLTVAPQWVPRMRPFVESWEHERGFPVAVEFNGTTDYTAWLAAPAGIELLRGLGVDRVRTYNAELARYGQHVLAEALGVAVDDPDPSPLAMRLVRLPYRADDHSAANRVEAAIRERLRTELAVTAFDGSAVLRIAAQVYNTTADYHRLARELPTLLKTLD